MARHRRKNTNRNFKSIIVVLALAVMVTLVAFAWKRIDKSALQTPQPPAVEHVTQDEKDAVSKPDWQTVDIPPSVASHLLTYPGFTVSFNPQHHQPNWVAWELTRDEVTSKVCDRSKSNFAPDPSVEGCATLDDYRGSGFDRGHMAPAGDMRWSKDAMDACFLLTNMSPQAKELNSGAWNKLEEKCRDWAVRDSAIVIITGPILTDRISRTIGASKVSVPERYFKVILAPYASEPRGIAFIMPNTKVQGGIQPAAVSIDEVERITGFDFFSTLPDDIEQRVESECNFPRWNAKK